MATDEKCHFSTTATSSFALLLTTFHEKNAGKPGFRDVAESSKEIKKEYKGEMKLRTLSSTAISEILNGRRKRPPKKSFHLVSWR